MRACADCSSCTPRFAACCLADEERRFRRILASILIVFATLGAVIPFLPLPERSAMPPALPDHVVRLVLDEPAPPPKIERRGPEARTETMAPNAGPVPVVPKLDARQRAEKAGVFQIRDELEELGEVVDTSKFAATPSVKGAAEGPSPAERSLITAGAATGSGGINTASLSRGYGAGVGALRGQVRSPALPLANESCAGEQPRRLGAGWNAARTHEEVELVFDRNKSALYAIYSRALRESPELQGKLVVQLTITPGGDMADCHVISSELDNPDLERKLVARIRMFRFAAKDVETMTATKPIEFLPA